MIRRHWGRLCHYLAALVAGALLPLTMAPWNLWGLAVVSLGLFAYLLRTAQSRPFLTALLFGLGLFGTGASWVYVSIHVYGNAGVALASLLTTLFVLALAVFFALPWLLLRLCRNDRLGFVLAFAGLWVLGEWLRGWLFTGFPWLYVGYGQLSSALSGWIPVIGVLGSGFLLALSSAPLGLLPELRSRVSGKKPLAVYGAVLVLVWGGGQWLSGRPWTAPRGSLDVTLIQPNIPLEDKWDAGSRQFIMERLEELSADHWDDGLLVWPEAAVPLVGTGQADYLRHLDTLALDAQSTLITGRLLYESGSGTYYNSLLALGTGQGDYHKSRLVPFGEYVPLEQQLRGLIAFFDLPTSVISVGHQNGLLQLPNDVAVASAICYEIAYAGQLAGAARDAQFILTVSNDAWFGNSIGPMQHLQIAQARALENGKAVVRATNNGFSALIDASGNLTDLAPRFEALSLSGQIELRDGSTPFGNWGHWPAILLGLLCLGGSFRWRKPDFSGRDHR